MNPAAIHLALNHFPPILDFAALIVLAIGLFHRHTAVVRTALMLFVLASIIAIPVFLTGEPAEHLVEELEGVNARAIHPHEEAAEWTFWLLCGQGVIALAVLVMFRARELARWAIVLVLIVSVFATLAAFRTAFLGGKIHHPESEMAR